MKYFLQNLSDFYLIYFLIKESSSPMKRLLKVKNGVHNFVWKHEGFAEQIGKFLNHVSWSLIKKCLSITLLAYFRLMNSIQSKTSI
jgi:hypothetical protein